MLFQPLNTINAIDITQAIKATARRVPLLLNTPCQSAALSQATTANTTAYGMSAVRELAAMACAKIGKAAPSTSRRAMTTGMDG